MLKLPTARHIRNGFLFDLTARKLTSFLGQSANGKGVELEEIKSDPRGREGAKSHTLRREQKNRSLSLRREQKNRSLSCIEWKR